MAISPLPAAAQATASMGKSQGSVAARGFLNARLLSYVADKITLPKSARKDAVYLAFEQAANVAIGFFVSILVVRYLGPEQYGIFSYASVWISVLAPLATIGLAGPLMQSIIQDPANTDRTITTVLTLRVVAAVAVACMAIGLVARGALLEHHGDAGYLTYIIGILALQYFAQALDVFETYNQASGRIRQTVRSRLVAVLFVSSLRVAAVLLNCPLTTFAWLVVLQLLIGFALTYSGIKPSIPRSPWAFDSDRARQLSSMGAFVVVAGLLNMVQARCEVFILERHAGMEAVGLYFASLRFIELFDTLGTIAVTIYLPRLLASSHRDTTGEHALVMTYRSALGLFIAIIPLIMAMAMTAYWLLGSRFTGIHWLILAMAYRPLFMFLGLTRSMHMLAENRLRYGALCSLTGMVVSVVSALLLIPKFGVYGAAASAFLGYFCSNLAIDALLNRKYFHAFVTAVTFK